MSDKFRFCISLFFAAMVSMLMPGCMNEESLPVSDEKLVPVLADVHVAETALLSFNEPEKDSIARAYYRQIMTIHDMDREVFDTCIAILRRNPELMEEIYDKVYKLLDAERQEIE